ncbi:HicB family protein [Lactobacillus sp. PV037]|uniref:type II toxin-antitoxin system HicB family antitoxin n=1 Tax=unclassified Lactobacillus TaxID=2620435 RepID=UPI00223FE398|nr:MULTISPECIES: type II toxin-antitoxin system HicB family antitoxin [unclassified Lactobacillus]QNQ82067.1 HicB family protein [Lactobacillus sp. PV012]QNQ83898.1 HicB family protein [Lactobacillus sp. PV037]
MKYVVYPAILDDSENEVGLYTVTFPDVEGAITDGKGEGEAMARGSEVLGAFLYDVPENKLPKPTSIERVKKENPKKLVVPIFSDLEKARKETKKTTIKKNTTIPSDLAYKAEQAGINFSQTLTEALEAKLLTK